MKKKTFIVAFIVLIIDLTSKFVLFNELSINKTYVIIKNFFSIDLVKNNGAAFSILENQNIFLISISVIILIYLLYLLNKQSTKFINYLSFGLLIGGLFGNLIDRLFLGYVRDFFSFKIFGYNFAIFNVADVAIVVGALILFILCIVGGKHEVNMWFRWY